MEKHDTMLAIEIPHKIRKNRTMLLTPTYSMVFSELLACGEKKRITEDKTVLFYNSGASLIFSINSISHDCSLRYTAIAV